MSKNETLTGDQLEMVMDDLSGSKTELYNEPKEELASAVVSETLVDMDVATLAQNQNEIAEEAPSTPLKLKRGNPFRKTVESEPNQNPMPKILGRMYIVAMIPFIIAVIAPLIFGPISNQQGFALVLWSYTVLLVVQGVTVGFRLTKNNQSLDLYAVVSLIIAALGFICVLVAPSSPQAFAGLALLTVLHRFSGLWLQKSRAVSTAFLRVHNRFIWTILIGHVGVLMTMIFAAKNGIVG